MITPAIPHHVARWIAILIALYVGFVAFLYVMQDSLIFSPPKMTEERWQQVAKELKGDYVTIRVNQEGIHLQGWFFEGRAGRAEAKFAGTQQQHPTLLFFGGNAQPLDHFAYLLDPIRDVGMNVLLVDYRGYGLSEGKPGTETMKTDAEKLFDAAAKHPQVDPDHISVWGISLGTGIATHLASVKDVEKLILMSPFTSTTDVAAEAYFFVPRFMIEALLRHKLDNLALALTLTQPALIIHGENDGEISVEHAKMIAAAWGGEAELLIVPGRGHGDLLSDRGVWESVVDFANRSP